MISAPGAARRVVFFSAIGFKEFFLAVSLLTMFSWTVSTVAEDERSPSLRRTSSVSKLPGKSDLVSLRDKDADRLFDQAGEAQNNGDFKFAIELWARFLEKYPKDRQVLKARHYYGVCLMTTKDYQKAAAAFAKVTSAADADKLPQLEESYYYLGWCQFSLGQADESNDAEFEAAIATFDKHANKFKDGKFVDQAWFLKGESLYFLGKKKESIDAYQKVVDQFKESTARPDAMYGMGVSCFETKNYEKAESVYDQFLTEYKDHELASEISLFKFESVLQRALSAEKTDSDQAKALFETAQSGLQKLASNEKFEKRDEAMFNQALCVSRLGDPAAAAAIYAELAEKFDQSTFQKSAQFSAGKLFLRANQLSEAEKWLKKTATTDSANTDQANHWLCRCLLRQDKPQDAASLAEAALKSAKDEGYIPYLKMDRADALYEIPASQKDTVEIYQQIATDHPQHPVASQALYNAAYGALEQKKFELGVTLAESFVDQFANDPFLADVKYVRAECLLLQQKHAEASKVFQDLTSNHADSDKLPIWQVRYGLTQYMQDQYKPAIDFLTGILDQLKEPTQIAEAKFLIGASHFYQDEFEKAIPRLQQATSDDNALKQLDEGLVLLAQALAKQEKFKDAITHLKRLLKVRTASRFAAQAQYLCGQYLAREKSFQEATTYFDQVLTGEETKYTAYAHYGKGWAALNQDQDQQAVKDFSALITDHPEHQLIADGYYSRAIAHRRIDENKKAIADIKSCFEKDDQFANRMSALYELGMAESADKQYSAAAKTFQTLVTDYPKQEDVDEFIYQLAWSYKYDGQNEKAVEAFEKLCADQPDSELAAEAHYHVGEHLYGQKKYADAIKEYQQSIDKSNQSEVGEKARYKLAWSHFQSKDYKSAQAAFKTQTEDFKDGSLLDSARFMVAESLYQQDKYNIAFAEFKSVKADVLSSDQTNETEKALTLLHGAESASKTRNYEEALSFIAEYDSLKDKAGYEAEVLLEKGIAQRGLKAYDKAIVALQSATDLSRGETGARAGFLIGEVYFDQKKYDDAIRQFKLVVYGFGGSRAPEPVRKWQWSAAYDTARCHQVQIDSESDPAKKKNHIDEAIKFFKYVVDNSDDKLADESKKQIAVLTKLQSGS